MIIWDAPYYFQFLYLRQVWEGHETFNMYNPLTIQGYKLQGEHLIYAIHTLVPINMFDRALVEGLSRTRKEVEDHCEVLGFQNMTLPWCSIKWELSWGSWVPRRDSPMINGMGNVVRFLSLFVLCINEIADYIIHRGHEGIPRLDTTIHILPYADDIFFITESQWGPKILYVVMNNESGTIVRFLSPKTWLFHDVQRNGNCNEVLGSQYVTLPWSMEWEMWWGSWISRRDSLMSR